MGGFYKVLGGFLVEDGRTGLEGESSQVRIGDKVALRIRLTT
ncbi:MAG: hypothetical protein OJF50_006093 [Nitrospira sp.]|nr:hypothetical protein [Nitrospira sp.]